MFVQKLKFHSRLVSSQNKSFPGDLGPQIILTAVDIPNLAGIIHINVLVLVAAAVAVVVIAVVVVVVMVVVVVVFVEVVIHSRGNRGRLPTQAIEGRILQNYHAFASLSQWTLKKKFELYFPY